MGSANSIVANRLDNPLAIVTFNNADNVYLSYNHAYITPPWGDSRVEAGADSWGLKVGIVYGGIGDMLLYRMWFCPNGSTLTVNSIYYDQIDASGCEHIGTNQISIDSDTTKGILDYLGLAADVISASGGFFYPPN